MSYDGPPILRNETRVLGLRVRSWVMAIGGGMALVAGFRMDQALGVYTAGWLLVYLGSRR